MNLELQEKISEVIGLDLSGFSTYNYDGDSYWLGCEITQWLGLSNTTQAIKAKIKFPSFRMEYIPHVNENRRVHLLLRIYLLNEPTNLFVLPTVIVRFMLKSLHQ